MIDEIYYSIENKIAKLICQWFGHKWTKPLNERYKIYCPRCQEIRYQDQIINFGGSITYIDFKTGKLKIKNISAKELYKK